MVTITEDGTDIYFLGKLFSSSSSGGGGGGSSSKIKLIESN